MTQTNIETILRVVLEFFDEELDDHELEDELDKHGASDLAQWMVSAGGELSWRGVENGITNFEPPAEYDPEDIELDDITYVMGQFGAFYLLFVVTSLDNHYFNSYRKSGKGNTLSPQQRPLCADLPLPECSGRIHALDMRK